MHDKYAWINLFISIDKKKNFPSFCLFQANAFRNSHRIYVRGSDIPDAMESFQVLDSSYSLPPYILKNVVSMGYSEPTPIQMQVIPLMLQV